MTRFASYTPELAASKSMFCLFGDQELPSSVGPVNTPIALANWTIGSEIGTGYNWGSMVQGAIFNNV